MEKMKLYTKHFTDEENAVFQLEYIILKVPAEQGKVYGVEIVKTDVAGKVEKDSVAGLCDNYEEAEQFISVLAEGLALPVELAVLCDDFVSEREAKEEQMNALAAS